MRSLSIVLPMPPNLTNRRGSSHWRTIHTAKLRYAAELDIRQAAKMLPNPPRTPFGPCDATAIMTLGARMDQDNLLARTKWAMDWLAKNGYIANDRDVNWTAIPTQVIRRGANYTIELTLTERSNG